MTSIKHASSKLNVWSFGRYTIIFAIVAMLVGNFIVDSPLWGFERELARQCREWLNTSTLDVTPNDLAAHNGENNNLPIWVGIDGDVYDVTASKRMYGPGGAYHCFAGKDAARAFVTGCFETHLTHDLRGLTPTELESLTSWKTFFRTHEKYRKVGRVTHPLIDSSSPIPEPCRPIVPDDVEIQKPMPVVRIQTRSADSSGTSKS